MVIAPSRPGTQLGPKSHPGSPEAHALARWISRSYRVHTGADLFRVESTTSD
ncbi:homeobox-leucine zipper protein ATHB-14-like, partial [Trifolium medium]|nr:homeobox-leucine zipper protein ATHB-14-like [Trifolium medium]